ncbi:MAG: ABC transporter ATP-binding protein [Nitrospirae bacterium]|nr:ABC transporter ATP-binding protein [Nitrospirota bacterium]
MLDLHRVTCGYRTEPVLRDVTFRIKDKELVGVIGPNGSGKTTLIRVLTKVIKPAAGEVLLEGKDLSRITLPELARRVAVVSRLRDPDGRMRVEDLVLLGRIPHLEGLKLLEKRADVDIAREVMGLTGISAFRDRFVESLSSGERQLAFIARALAQEPKLLFLDEPTSHLDLTHQVEVLDLIRKLNRERGLTVIMVLHDLNLASQYCDRLLLFRPSRRLWRQ